ncbi:hypothetical protein GGX14DRAFT_603971, partial [Mycena pura]
MVSPSLIHAGLAIHFALSVSALVIPRAAPGTQFITGSCTADADCASGCCSAATALCAARLVALEGAGCGFGSPSAGAGAAKPVATTGSAPASVAAAPAATGTQFITGACTSDADCASGCCALNTGLCAARLVAEEGAGCGFGGSSLVASSAAAATSVAAAAPSAVPEPAAPDAASSVSAAPAATGTQFITGACTADADCASGCCALNTGLCAARLVAEEGSGCGFGGSSPSAPPVAASLVSPVASAPAATGTQFASPVAASLVSPVASAPAATGTQFITGTCTSDAACASECCALNTGLCAGRLVAEEGAGCGF